MNEPLNAATIERYRDCTAPRVPAVEEMADSHELLRSMLAERDREIAEAKKILAEELTKNSALRSKLDFLKLCEKMAAEYLAEAKTFRARWEAAENRGETERIRADENYVNFCSVRRQLEELRADRDRLDKLADQYGSNLATAELELAELRARVTGLEAERIIFERLIARLDYCHEHPLYRAVWESYMLHVGNYTGPQYGSEMEAALAALSADPLKVGEAVNQDAEDLNWIEKHSDTVLVTRGPDGYTGVALDFCRGPGHEIPETVEASSVRVAVAKARALSAVMKGEG